MTELVQNMMSLAQMDLEATKKHEAMQMDVLLAEIVNEFSPQAHEMQQQLNYTAPSPASVNGDPLQLRQLFRNLIGNAIKYTPRGGNINVKAVASQDELTVKVEDNGYGIPASDLPFIFNRFYRVRNSKTTEIEGNGLGLAIVKSIAEQHGGDITVESELQKGSCFTITLPLLNKFETSR